MFLFSRPYSCNTYISHRPLNNSKNFAVLISTVHLTLLLPSPDKIIKFCTLIPSQEKRSSKYNGQCIIIFYTSKNVHSIRNRNPRQRKEYYTSATSLRCAVRCNNFRCAVRCNKSEGFIF